MFAIIFCYWLNPSHYFGAWTDPLRITHCTKLDPKATVRNLSQVGYDLVESYPTRPGPSQLGCPSRQGNQSQTRSGSTRRLAESALSRTRSEFNSDHPYAPMNVPRIKQRKAKKITSSDPDRTPSSSPSLRSLRRPGTPFIRRSLPFCVSPCNAPIPLIRGRYCNVYTQVRNTLTYIR